MRKEDGRIAVLGLVIAGATIARAFARQGHQVTALDRADGVASSRSNQQWEHSGSLYYDHRVLAARLWRAYRDQDPLLRRHLLVAGAHFLAHGEQTLVERDATWADWGIPYARLARDAVLAASVLGQPKVAGGFATPDAVVDYPRVLADLLTEARTAGARMLAGATVRRLVREGDAIAGVVYTLGRGAQILLCCDWCIVTMGAWAPALLREIGVSLPIRNTKSHILTLRGELVPRITVFLDQPRLTLVPYRGRTLVADTRRVAARDGDDRRPEPGAGEALLTDLPACFPRLTRRSLQVEHIHGCIKTEFACAGEARDQDSCLFGPADHGIVNLTVAFPGKASLAFQLARAADCPLLGLSGGVAPHRPGRSGSSVPVSGPTAAL
jgi:glycine/D-amino acid oxidase-like deaminating enzyme